MTCGHPTSSLENPSIPSVGDTIQGDQVALQADCTECGETILIDARIREKMVM